MTRSLASEPTNQQNGGQRAIWQRLPPGVAMLAMAGCAGLFLFVALSRIGHPFELEWLESAMFEQVARLLAGEPLYCPPSLDYGPTVYTPLFHWLSAGVSQVIGEGFTALRLCAFLPSLATCVLLFLIVRDATGKPAAGLAACGMFVATYAATGTWFDVGRVDNLAQMLSVAALWLARRSGWRAAAAAGLVAGLSILGKQTYGVSALPMLAALALYRRRDAMVALVACIALVAGVLGALHLASDGWSSFFLIEVLLTHGFVPEHWLGFWTHDLLGQTPVLLVAGAIFLFGGGIGIVRERAVIVAFVVGSLLNAYSGRVHFGGWLNALLAAYVVLAVATGCVLAAVERLAERRPRLVPLVAVAWLAVAAQAVMGWFDPRPSIPTAADVAVGQRLVTELRALPGPIFLPEHGALARMAGHRPTAHIANFGDLLTPLPGLYAYGPKSAGRFPRVERIGYQMLGELQAAIAERRYRYLVLDDGELWLHLPLRLLEHYELDRVLLGDVPPAVFQPVVRTNPQRPTLLLRPKPR